MADQAREPTIVVRGDVSDRMVAYAHDKLLAIVAHAPAPVLDLELRLDHHADPARDRPDHVEVSLDLDGTLVRAHRSAATMSEAIDRALARLRRRIEAAAERPQSLQLRHRDSDSWHHDDRLTQRPKVYQRPPDERDFVRHKTFALRPESSEDALFDLETVDHDFFLFVHDETGAEAVVYRVGGGYGIMQRVATPEAIERVENAMTVGPHPSTMTLDDATSILDEGNATLVFFVEELSDRGLVIYRRYDGHYGLILPK